MPQKMIEDAGLLAPHSPALTDKGISALSSLVRRMADKIDSQRTLNLTATEVQLLAALGIPAQLEKARLAEQSAAASVALQNAGLVEPSPVRRSEPHESLD